MIFLTKRLLVILTIVTLTVADRIYICQHQLKVTGDGFLKFHDDCRNYDDAVLARTSFNEDREVWIRNGTIDDIDRLLNGSLYHVTHLKITNLAAGEGSRSLERFPIEPERFAVLDLTNSGIQRLEIKDVDYRLTHLDVKQNRLTTLTNMKFLTGLESLKADRNAIDSFSLDDFKDLKQLIVLSLKSNQIKSVTATGPIFLPKLRSLFLSDNQLTDLNVTHWEFPNLNSFFVDDNSLTVISGNSRGKFPNTWEIALGGRNNWDCQWFDNLLAFLKEDRRFALQMFGDEPSCPDQSRMEGFICCRNVYDNQVA
ncbi:uncharacterized protein LOC129756250 [Uranotaenia lowii]|uniref:uncharacterized protein LOC129756250 n=1 Tax=Uranotaenia lowii TaxID=190385 RepID=UPI0024784041|nr:uncharacterized protein LOC129756250 [Uranotaenia lowii]